MEDFEKNRMEYVQHLERQMKHMSHEHEVYKEIATKWQPKITTVSDVASGKVTFGLEFGGKHVHATVTSDWLNQTDATSGTTTIVEALVQGLIFDQFRILVKPEFERIKKATAAIQGAGQW